MKLNLLKAQNAVVGVDAAPEAAEATHAKNLHSLLKCDQFHEQVQIPIEGNNDQVISEPPATTSENYSSHPLFSATISSMTP